jgi:general secretion pathway protein I
MTKNKIAGFTLIEVLVALVVITIALTAVLVATQTYIKSTNYLRSKTMAQWVAMNLVSDLQTGLISPDKEQLTGETSIMNHSWQWSIDSQTSSQTMKQLLIRVSESKNSPALSQITTLTSSGS